MTCLLAIETKDEIHYAGDRRAMSNHNIRICSESKWMSHRNWRIGGCGSAKSFTVMLTDTRWQSILGIPGEETEAQVYAFVRCLRDLIEADGWVPEKKDGYPVSFISGFLVVGPPGVFMVCDNFEVCRMAPGTLAVLGSGTDLATGAWHAAEQLGEKHPLVRKMTTKEKLQLALEAAAAHNVTCGPPFDFGVVEARKSRR